MAAARQAGPLSELHRQARRAGLSWLDSFETVCRPPSAASCGGRRTAAAVFAHVDGNLANYLWDGRTVRLVDFEDSGRGDRAQELADFVEHLSVWDGGGVHARAFLDRFDLTRPERQRIGQLRRLFAVFWVMMLLPGGRAHRRNPPGTADRQASRALALLG
jgi:Ser/Thr protein kinase RdoA (MazF antagonist)